MDFKQYMASRQSDDGTYADTSGSGAYTFGAGLQNLWNRITGSGLTNAEKQANAYSASQAEIARQWEEEMKQKYSTPEGYKAMGLNPALMYEGVGSTGLSSSSPSSVQPQNSGNPLDRLMNAIGLKLNIARQQAEIKNINADTNNKETTNGKITAEIDAIKTGIEKTKSDIQNNEVQRELWGADITKKQAEIALTNMQTLIAKVDATTRSKVISSSIKLQKSQIALNNAQKKLTERREELTDSQRAKYDKEILRLQEESKYWKQIFREQYDNACNTNDLIESKYTNEKLTSSKIMAEIIEIYARSGRSIYGSNWQSMLNSFEVEDFVSDLSGQEIGFINRKTNNN